MDLRLRGAVRTKPTLSPKAFIDGSRSSRMLRKPSTNGVVTSFLGESFVMVRHVGDNESAIYFEDELEATAAYWTVTHETEAGLFFKEFDDYETVESYLDYLGVDKKDATIEGPVFGSKELKEGLVPLRDMFDHLLDEDDNL